MIYVNSDYENYDNLVSVSDNYVVLTNRSSVSADWQNPKSIDIIYQFFDSPFNVIESERTFTSSQVFPKIDTTNNIMFSSQYPNFVICVLLVVMFILYIINPITKIIKKGGMFFGS